MSGMYAADSGMYMVDVYQLVDLLNAGIRSLPTMIDDTRASSLDPFLSSSGPSSCSLLPLHLQYVILRPLHQRLVEHGRAMPEFYFTPRPWLRDRGACKPASRLTSPQGPRTARHAPDRPFPRILISRKAQSVRFQRRLYRCLLPKAAMGVQFFL